LRKKVAERWKKNSKVQGRCGIEVISQLAGERGDDGRKIAGRGGEEGGRKMAGGWQGDKARKAGWEMRRGRCLADYERKVARRNREERWLGDEGEGGCREMLEGSWGGRGGGWQEDQGRIVAGR
jgi:hypothetical protein